MAAAGLISGPSAASGVATRAALVAKDGDVIEIDPGAYAGDVAPWPQNQLLRRGAGVSHLIKSIGKVIQQRDV